MKINNKILINSLKYVILDDFANTSQKHLILKNTIHTTIKQKMIITFQKIEKLNMKHFNKKNKQYTIIFILLKYF